MGFRFRPDETFGDKRQQVVDQRRAMKPEPGDIVEYMGERYKVVAVGNRMCRMAPENNPANIVCARLDMVLKVSP